MDRQELDAHGSHAFRGAPNGFFDVEKFQVEEHSLAAFEETLDHFGPRSRKQLQAHLHEGDLVLYLVHEPFSFGCRRDIKGQNQPVARDHSHHNISPVIMPALTLRRALC